MSLKNYYVILGVPQSANREQIRNAYRALVKKYHPDKAPDNPFADAHFKEIQEAYEVLSDQARRAKYDEERWLRGLSNRSKNAVQITPEWLLGEAQRLRKHMNTVDTYHMNHAALRDYVVALLKDEHLSVLQGNGDTSNAIADEIFNSTRLLHHRYTPDVKTVLMKLAHDNQSLQNRIFQWEAQRRREYNYERYRPFIVLLFAILIALLIWWLK